jgi:hypothetical protein
MVAFWCLSILLPSGASIKLDLVSRNQTWIPLATLILGAFVGLIDDYMEIIGSRKEKGKGARAFAERLIVHFRETGVLPKGTKEQRDPLYSSLMTYVDDQEVERALESAPEVKAAYVAWKSDLLAKRKKGTGIEATVQRLINFYDSHRELPTSSGERDGEEKLYDIFIRDAKKLGFIEQLDGRPEIKASVLAWQTTHLALKETASPQGAAKRLIVFYKKYGEMPKQSALKREDESALHRALRVTYLEDTDFIEALKTEPEILAAFLKWKEERLRRKRK